MREKIPAERIMRKPLSKLPSALIAKPGSFRTLSALLAALLQKALFIPSLLLKASTLCASE